VPHLSRILFPVDFSPRCAKASSAVRAVAGQFKAKLSLLHSIGSAPVYQIAFPDQMYATLRTGLRATAYKSMQQFVEQNFRDFPVRQVIEEREPSEAILAHAHKSKADLIMMPTHGYGPFRRFLIGSVTAKVLHGALCPVWTSSHASGARVVSPGPYRNILCAADTSSDAVPLLRWASWLARRYEATLELVHVIPAMDETSRNIGEKRLREYLRERAESAFQEILDQAGLRCEVLLRGGSLPQRLALTARQQRADLVIIGRGHLRKNLGRLRTNTLAIVSQSPCPVISV